MSAITTHVLDIARGRASTLLPADHRMETGLYRLIFSTDAFFRAAGLESFYPEIVVTFTVRDPRQKHHVPLLLGPFGYTTYRGS